MNTFEKVKIVTTWADRFQDLRRVDPDYTQKAFCDSAPFELGQTELSRWMTQKHLPEAENLINVEGHLVSEEIRMGIRGLDGKHVDKPVRVPADEPVQN